MDFSGAIRAHSNWRLRLAAYCRGNLKEAIDIHTLQKDNACELGKWLYGEGQMYLSDPKFGELIDAHAAFHRSAAAIAALVGNGRLKEAETLINSSDAEFGKLSLRVVGILMKFRTQYGK